MPTIWRVLKARGFVTPQPHKRPKGSWTRFEADLPNECWQADVTHVEVAGGVIFEVLNVIDDHSRLCVASRAFVSTRSPDVVRTLHKAAETWGYPQSFLTDNGAIFTASKGAGVGAMEAELLSLGMRSQNSSRTSFSFEAEHSVLMMIHPAPPNSENGARTVCGAGRKRITLARCVYRSPFVAVRTTS